MSIELLKLDKSYIYRIGDLLSDSFFDNPLMIYFFEDEEIRKKVLPKIYRSVAQITMALGSVYATSENLEGVIGVLHKKKKGLNLNLANAILKAFIINLPSLRYVSIIDIIKKSKCISMDNYPKNLGEYFFIEMVAVDKKYRGQKYMSKLIKAVLKEVDSHNSLCVLQTETLKNCEKYEHLGFMLYDKIESIPNKLYHYVLIYNSYNKKYFD